MKLYKRPEYVADLSEFILLLKPETEGKEYYENLLQDDVLTCNNSIPSTRYGNIIFYKNGITQTQADAYVNLLKKYKNEKKFIRNFSTYISFNRNSIRNVHAKGENFVEDSLEKHENSVEEMIQKYDTIQVFTEVEEFRFTDRSIFVLVK